MNIQQRKTQDGKVSYRVQVRLKGYPPQTATFDRKTDAKRWAQSTESAIRDGRYFPTSEARRHTLSELIERYLPRIRKQIKTSDARERHLTRWKSELGYFTLADITPVLIADIRDKLLDEKTKRGTPRSPATVVRYLASLSHAFTYAVKECGWVEANPVLRVSKPKEPRGRDRFLSNDERGRLLATCRESSNPCLYPIVLLALSTGMRQGEIMNLRWSDVDLQKDQITLHETKNDEKRVVPLIHGARNEIHKLSEEKRLDSPLLFPSKGPRSGKRRQGTTITKPMDLRFPFLKALRTAEIEDFRFHDLRHSAASELAMNGATPSEIAQVLGHKTFQMVKRYAHLSNEHTRKVLVSMNEKVFG